MGEKYVELKHVEELISLIKRRDRYNEWSSEYNDYNNRFNYTIELLKLNAIEIDSSKI